MKAKELAKEIGVSEATLSLVLNGKPGISQKTREKVENRIVEMGLSHMLKKEASADAASKVITFVLFKENGKLLGSNTFFPYILEGLESSARLKGYALNIVNIEKNNLEDELPYITDSNCSGFVIFGTEMHEDILTRFEALGLPFVILDNEFPERSLNYVKVNNQQGTWLAVKHLKEMGHKRIGYLSSGLEINSFKERQRCALSAIAELGLEGGKESVYTIGYAHDHAEEGMDALLDSTGTEGFPTAFLADNDHVAIGAIQSLRKHGFKVPEEFSFVGFDDRPFCTLISPNLTTIQLPRELFGAEAVNLLIRQLEEGMTPGGVSVEINCRLIERDSVARIS